MTVLTSTQVPLGTAFRLRLRAPDGHLVSDGTPRPGAELQGSTGE